MKFFCNIILITLCYTIHSQVYKPVISQSKEWFTINCIDAQNCIYDYYKAFDDTTINGERYIFLDNFHYNKNFLLREDTLKQQIYIRILSETRPKDYLIYDFSLSVGDSIYLENPISPATHLDGIYTLDSISSGLFFNINRRVFHLSGSIHQTTWIEGIGSLSLINTPAAQGDSSSFAELLCVYENGSPVYQRKLTDSCYHNSSLMLPNAEVVKPNLYYANQTIIFEPYSDLYQINIYKNSGELMESKTTQANRVPFTPTAPGIYFLVLTDLRRQITTYHKIFAR